MSLFLAAATALGQQYTMSTLAGGRGIPTPIDALMASIVPAASATDAAGNLYFSSGRAIFKLGRDGILNRFADPGAAAGGMAFDAAGNLFFTDPIGRRIRRISPDGIITTVAGDAGCELRDPLHLGVDTDGNLYFTESEYQVRKLSPAGDLSTVAGTGGLGPAPAEGSPASGALFAARALAVSPRGDLFIADDFNHRVWRVSSDGAIRTFAGNGNFDSSGDGGPAIAAAIGFPYGVAVDSAGSVYIADPTFHNIRKVASNGIISSLTPHVDSSCGGVNGPYGLSIDAAGNVYASEFYRIQKISPSGIVETVAGNNTDHFSGDGGPASAAQVNSPWGVAVDPHGSVYFSDAGNWTVRRIDSSGVIATLIGDGTTPVHCGIGPSPTDPMSYPMGIALNPASEVFVVSLDNRVRKASPNGAVSVVAGNGTQSRADGFNMPHAVAFDSNGNLYVADSANYWIVRIAPDGARRIFAGTGAPGYSGDGGPAIAAQLYAPTSMVFDPAGNLFFADTGNHVIRKISVDGIITTVAGTGLAGNSGDGGSALQARLNGPQGLAIDSVGALFISDTNNSSIRRVSPTGVIETITAKGQLNTPYAIALDAQGRFYVADSGNRAVRMLTPQVVPVQ